MDPRDEMEPDQMEMLAGAFREQLMACLQECAHGRKGLFSDLAYVGDDLADREWPEAARLRELALGLQGVFAQQEKPNPLCDEFLDLCSIHGESNPGEQRLARSFLARIAKGQVGVQPEQEKRPW
jgi:hypothetical protein